MVVDSHLRSDAQRNLERILEAAHAVFAERGLDASVADVAERAGVGTATIFRRFPTKDELIVAVLESELHRMLVEVEAAHNLAEVMTTMLERYISARSLCDAVGSELFEQPSMRALKERMHTAIEALLRREQDAGTIRKDVTIDDLDFLINALGQAGIRTERTEPGAWRKYVDVVLAGLRP